MKAASITALEVQNLIRKFAGKRVKITHTNPACSNASGTCRTFHETERGHVDIELEDGSRYGFIPDTIGDNFVEGVLGGWAGGRRKFTIDE